MKESTRKCMKIKFIVMFRTDINLDNYNLKLHRRRCNSFARETNASHAAFGHKLFTACGHLAIKAA